MTLAEQLGPSPAEAVQLASTDGKFFARYYFPKTTRQESPPWEPQVWNLLDNPAARYSALKMFRGAAKTTRARIFAAKRAAFGFSRTILYVGKSQDHAARSVEWILKQIETNANFRDSFRLSPGSKWTGSEVEIINGLLGISVRILALGISGSIRGVNIDDYRPDLIIGDDILDEENTSTRESREKMEDLWFGALKESLAPASECPDAKQVLLSSPFLAGDLIDKCCKDESYKSLTISIFDNNGESSWPSRWSTQELQREKEAAVRLGKLSLWLREKECTIVAREEASFQDGWLQRYDVLPAGLTFYIGVDPTPPPKEKGGSSKRSLDDAAIVVIGVKGPSVYLAAYYVTKSPDPDEFITQLFNMVIQFRPVNVGIESILFARVVKSLIEKEMLKRRLFFLLTPVEDKRKKMVRIEQALTGRAAARQIFVNPAQIEAIQQFTLYPNVEHDDILDAFAIAIELINPNLEMAESLEDEAAFEELDYKGDCP